MMRLRLSALCGAILLALGLPVLAQVPGFPPSGSVQIGQGNNLPVFTITPTLGNPGSTAGTLSFANTSGGTIKLQAGSGALGSSVLTLPTATDTLIGKATTDTLTNKTYDTAGSGNSFLINGLAATANTGTGSVVRATSPTLTTPTLSTPTVSGHPTIEGVTSTGPTGTGNFVFATSPTISAPTISGHPTVEGVTSTGATGTGKFVFDTSPTIHTPTITGGTINGANVCSNNYLAKSSNYIPADTDTGSTIDVTNRSTIQFSTSPGFYTSGDCFTIHNKNASVAAIVAVNLVNYFLWPDQTETVRSINGVLTYSGPHRYVNSPRTIYMGPAGSCNDSNDGLSADSAGQLCTINTALALFKTSYDTGGLNPGVKLADGTYIQSIIFAGQCGVCSADGINITGHSGSPSSVVLQAPTSGTILSVRDTGLIFLNSLEITCTASGSAGINVSQNSTIDLTEITMGSCDSHTPIEAQDGGHIDFDGSFVIAGNAATFLYTNGVGAQIELESQTVTCSGSPAFSNYTAEAVDLSQILAVSVTFSGCGSATGVRYLAQSNAIISTGGGGANYFPGNSAGSVSTGGIYE